LEFEISLRTSRRRLDAAIDEELLHLLRRNLDLRHPVHCGEIDVWILLLEFLFDIRMKPLPASASSSLEAPLAPPAPAVMTIFLVVKEAALIQPC